MLKDKVLRYFRIVGFSLVGAGALSGGAYLTDSYYPREEVVATRSSGNFRWNFKYNYNGQEMSEEKIVANSEGYVCFIKEKRFFQEERYRMDSYSYETGFSGIPKTTKIDSRNLTKERFEHLIGIRKE